MRALRAAGRLFVDALFPPLCRLCGGWIAADARANVCVCAGCWASIEPVGAPYCVRCGVVVSPGSAHFFLAATPEERRSVRRYETRPEEEPAAVCRDCRRRPPPYRLARGCVRYDGALREIVQLLKYQPRPSLAVPLSGFLAAFLALHPAWLADRPVAVPAPMHPVRRRERGFNQAERLAEETLRRLAPDAADFAGAALARVRPTRAQFDLGWRERLENVRGAFAPGPEAGRVRGRPALLFDDVLTTGATAAECAKALLAAGAAEVRVLALSRDAYGAPPGDQGLAGAGADG